MLADHSAKHILQQRHGIQDIDIVQFARRQTDFRFKETLMLCAARLRHLAGTQWGSKRHLNMDLLREHDVDKSLELAEAI